MKRLLHRWHFTEYKSKSFYREILIFLNFSPSTRPKFPKFPSNFSSKTKTSKFPIKNHSRTVPKHSITTIMHFKLNFSLYLSNSSGFASCRMQKTTQNVHKHFERQKKIFFLLKIRDFILLLRSSFKIIFKMNKCRFVISLFY